MSRSKIYYHLDNQTDFTNITEHFDNLISGLAPEPVFAPVSDSGFAPVSAPFYSPVSDSVFAPVSAPVYESVFAPVSVPVSAPVYESVFAPVSAPVYESVFAPATPIPISSGLVYAPASSKNPIIPTDWYLKKLILKGKNSEKYWIVEVDELGKLIINPFDYDTKKIKLKQRW